MTASPANVLAIAVALSIVLPANAETPPTVTERGVLTERTGRDLAQIEVMVDGSREITRGLTVQEFELLIAGHPVDIIAADNLCRDESTDESKEPLASTVPAVSMSVLFYFDQHNLTIEGRQNSVRLAKEMVAELVGAGHRASIVSAGDQLATVSGFSDDIGKLHVALDALRKDRTQFDEYSTLEPNRHQHIMEAGWSSDSAACALAKSYQTEEIARTEGALELFSSVLGRFLNENPPKVAVYFGDTMRLKAGRHYFAAAGTGCVRNPFDAFWAFQRVTQDAAAFGVRVYAVQAAGLTDSTIVSRTAQAWATQDSQGGLKALALDTGGDAFLGGASAKTMVKRINKDSDCVYVLNFDPASLPRDQALAIRVKLKRPEIRVRSRSQIVLQSESTRRTSELLSAFASPDAVKDRWPIYGAVVPIEFRKGRFRALVQVVIPEAMLPDGEEWDIGASLVFGSVVRSDESGRIAVDRAGIPLVLESEMIFRPGPFDVMLVGQELRSGGIAAGRISGEWPRAREAPAITDIVILQPTDGAFLRDEESRTKGSLAVRPDGSVRAGQPTAILSLVCRPRDWKKAIIVERSVTGETEVRFPPLEFLPEDDLCVQIRDLVPAKTLTSGAFSYTVRMKGTSVKRSREFEVLDEAAHVP